MQRGYLELDVMKDIEIPVEELEKFRLEPNDLLITEGGDWDKVGRTAIVAKVDELMRWCDALEARLTAAQTTAAQLLDATLHQILTA